jgi:hypothetical protein
MTRNKRKAYRQLARGRAKQLGGIFKFLRGLFIVKKSGARFWIDRKWLRRNNDNTVFQSVGRRIGNGMRAVWDAGKRRLGRFLDESGSVYRRNTLKYRTD